MSKIYSKYIKNEDHNWYDSSNIVYSVCFDGAATKSLKIVFKGGRTYLYKDVSPVDYVRFRDAESNGKVFNEVIKQYPCTKLDDTSLEQLENMKNEVSKVTYRLLTCYALWTLNIQCQKQKNITKQSNNLKTKLLFLKEKTA